MSILIGVLITFLVIILVLYLLNMLPIDGRAKQIVRVIVIIIGVISLLKYLAVFWDRGGPGVAAAATGGGIRIRLTNQSHSTNGKRTVWCLA
jgi:hypothetical protein